ncbi:MAG: tripartite tricarboxylate transporter substrate binding protein [Proteobacteria bacterium]|nr:tripartite tricarboxylate transporter substrate binding protein [Burkholderiales bacterium]
MKTRVPALMAAAVAALALAIGSSLAWAQAYPAKPIRMIVPISAGGGTDAMGRLIAQRLGDQMGVSIFVDNRPGAGTVIGTELVARAAPDGYTLMTVAPEFVINPGLRKLPYDPIKDFTVITQLTSGQYYLSTHPSVPVKTTREFIALAKARPGQVTFGSSGNGSANHLAGVLFQHMTGTRLVHVPYKGAGPAGAALIGGQIDFMFSNIASAIPYVKAGKLRVIAATGDKRSAVSPEVPTVAESGVPGFVVTGFYLLMAPAGIPREVLSRLHAESVKALQSATFKETLASLGLDPVGTSPEQASAFVQAEIAKWGPVIKAAGAQTD